MTNENTAGPGIVALDTRVVRATVSVASLARQGDAGALGQIVAMLGRSPSWPR